MTPYGEWLVRTAAAPRTTAPTLIGLGALVVISPHPDDETLGASALIAGAADAGLGVGLVALTDGEGSHKGSRACGPARLKALRSAEQAAALAILTGRSGTPTLRLGLVDGRARYDAGFADAAERVAAFCDRLGATAFAATIGYDPHPDHHAAAALADALARLRPALRRLSYPVWAVRLEERPHAPVETQGLLPFRLATPLARKAAALEAHATQLGRVVTDDPEGFALPSWFLAHHRAPFETVLRHAMPGEPPGPEHFARLYGQDGDPWGVRSSAYEAGKREHAAAFLPPGPLGRLVELGCGEGQLTALLAPRADRALGIDRDPGIIARARRLHGAAGIAFAVGSVPGDVPDAFDTLLVSELLYFLDEARIGRLVELCTARTAPGAHILLVNYLGATDAPLSGEDAADLFLAFAEGWETVRTAREPRYRLDLLHRRAAGREGQ